MAQFSIPIPLARLYPVLSSDDSIFIKDLKKEGYSNIDAFKALLALRNVVIPAAIDNLN